MSIQNLIIYKSNSLYHILEELDLDLNFKFYLVNDEFSLINKIKNLNNYLILTNKKNLKFNNQFILDNKPIKIFKLIEKINIEFLRIQFINQSQVQIKNYTIDLNSREMVVNNTQLKLTEKEINTINYLYKLNRQVSIDELQKNVWGYQSDIETHTVETHIYRLRKKILNKFNDSGFIVSEKNGYQIK